MKYDYLIGKQIRIIELNDVSAEKYINIAGTVETVGRDPMGDEKLNGTWGAVSVYPQEDKFEVLD